MPRDGDDVALHKIADAEALHERLILQTAYDLDMVRHDFLTPATQVQVDPWSCVGGPQCPTVIINGLLPN